MPINSVVKTLRDEFAMAALTGYLASDAVIRHPDNVAREAYEYADAMIEVRKPKPPAAPIEDHLATAKAVATERCSRGHWIGSGKFQCGICGEDLRNAH